MKQARAEYVRIVDPSNRALNEYEQDYTDRVPLAQFRADVRAYIAATRKLVTQMSADRWPARVAPYIHAMLTTDVQAGIRCNQHLLRARSYSQAETISLTNQDCTDSNTTANADRIRSMLHLPSLEG